MLPLAVRTPASLARLALAAPARAFSRAFSRALAAKGKTWGCVGRECSLSLWLARVPGVPKGVPGVHKGVPGAGWGRAAARPLLASVSARLVRATPLPLRGRQGPRKDAELGLGPRRGPGAAAKPPYYGRTAFFN